MMLFNILEKDFYQENIQLVSSLEELDQAIQKIESIHGTDLIITNYDFFDTKHCIGVVGSIVKDFTGQIIAKIGIKTKDLASFHLKQTRREKNRRQIMKNQNKTYFKNLDLGKLDLEGQAKLIFTYHPKQPNGEYFYEEDLFLEASPVAISQNGKFIEVLISLEEFVSFWPTMKEHQKDKRFLGGCDLKLKFSFTQNLKFLNFPSQEFEIYFYPPEKAEVGSVATLFLSPVV